MLSAQTLAFPGAEGFGAYAEGGRGGDVYQVTNLNDSGPGSLRQGISSATGPRTIVFTVSGLIQLESGLKVDKDYITIAGQTAPGDGICVRDYTLSISADHVIVRFLRSRLGADGGQEADAISITRGNHIIMDHCSASWSVDEVFSCSTGDPDTIDNVTVQWSIISEGLGDSIHTKGYHSYGALIRGCHGAKYSYHHNLFAHNNGRNPRPGNYDENDYISDPLGLQFDFRNNVIYNWGGDHPSYDADADSICRMNYVGNYCKAGPSSSYGELYDTGSPHFMGYYEGNYWNGSIPSDPYSLIDFGSWSSAEIASWTQSAPFSTGPIATQTAQDAYASVLADVGASLARDSIDARIVNEVSTGTVTYYGSVSGKAGIIDDESDVGGWPVYSSTTPLPDSDQDGMPDAWETARGLNSNNASDRNGYDLDPDYTNLEVYLNGLVAHLFVAAPTDYESWQLIHFDGDSSGALNGTEISHAARANDFDLDDYLNEYEYYFGLDPKNPVNARELVASTVLDAGNRYPAITYMRRPLTSGVSYTVVSSDDLLSWTNASMVQVGGIMTNGVDGAETLTLRTTTLPSPAAFFRVKAEE